MNWTFETVRHALGDRLVGNLFMRKLVCQTLLYLPPEILDQVCRKVWFISSQEDSWAFTFRGSDIKDRHLIFMSDELLRQSDAQIGYTILHEVGHVVLMHKNSIGYAQTQSEIKNQEKEADLFAKKHLR